MIIIYTSGYIKYIYISGVTYCFKGGASTKIHLHLIRLHCSRFNYLTTSVKGYHLNKILRDLSPVMMVGWLGVKMAFGG